MNILNIVKLQIKDFVMLILILDQYVKVILFLTTVMKEMLVKLLDVVKVLKMFIQMKFQI